MTKRKFYKTIIQVEVLSEEPFMHVNLEDIAYEIKDGHCSGVIDLKGSKVINGKQAAKALIKQGSDPEFFEIDSEGNDLKEDDDNGQILAYVGEKG